VQFKQTSVAHFGDDYTWSGFLKSTNFKWLLLCCRFTKLHDCINSFLERSEKHVNTIMGKTKAKATPAAAAPEPAAAEDAAPEPVPGKVQQSLYILWL